MKTTIKETRHGIDLFIDDEYYGTVKSHSEVRNIIRQVRYDEVKQSSDDANITGQEG